MTSDNPADRLGRRLDALRRALERGDEVDTRALSDLVDELQGTGRDEAQGAALRADRLIGLLDDASALRVLLERNREALRQAIEGAERRRRGRSAYLRSARS